MMKTQITIALAALAALAATANAQTIPDNGDGVQLRDIPNLGELFRSPTNPYVQPLFGPEMPPRPKLDSASPAHIKISVLPTLQGEVFQVEAVRQSRAAILKKITDVMGVRAVIDPQLENKITLTQAFRGLNWDDLLASVNYGVEMVKSPAGTYFFADKPVASGGTVTYRRMPDGTWQRADDSRDTLRITPRFDSFVFPRGGLNPDYQPPMPQSDWQKREFNGHEFYYIPGLPPAKFYPIK